MEDNSQSQQTGTPPDKKGITRNEYIDILMKRIKDTVSFSSDVDEKEFLDTIEDFLTETLPLQFEKEEEDNGK